MLFFFLILGQDELSVSYPLVSASGKKKSHFQSISREKKVFLFLLLNSHQSAQSNKFMLKKIIIIKVSRVSHSVFAAFLWMNYPLQVLCHPLSKVQSEFSEASRLRPRLTRRVDVSASGSGAILAADRD